jgi:electron transfer flavoprotein alpha subunit
MAVLVYVESPKGQFKKNGFEAVTYGSKIAAQLGVECYALTLGSVTNGGVLGEYGAKKVFNIADNALNSLDSQVHTQVIARAAQELGASVVILSHTATGKSLAGRLAIRLKAGLVSGANGLPTIGADFVVTKSVFSGKAIAHYKMIAGVKVISLMGNAVAPEANGSAVVVESLNIAVPARRVTVKEVKTVEGTVPLPEAEVVVSAGRGMKGPENWGIVEELAQVLGATTACSRPVADAHWRPHHEHVGQTGIAIRPNLYFAIGISGAIQHLAGVNNSRVIVVVNKDPEAPFFKAADYGIVGDLFDIVPKITEAVKKFKAAQN